MAEKTILIADKPTLEEVRETTKLIYDALSDSNMIYGFIERGDVLSPSQRIEYIGANKDFVPFSLNTDTGAMSLNSWSGFDWLEQNRPAMVKNDGTVDYWLDDHNYTLKYDGTASDVSNVDYEGNAMAWIPKIYKYEKQVGADRIVKFSMRKLEGFEPIGFVDEENNELDGVWIPMFYGWLDTNKKMRSIANGDIASHSLTCEQEWTAISANGSRARFFGGSIVETLIDLMILFAKTTDLQTAYGKGNSYGYNSTDTTTYGKTANLATNCGQFYGTSDGKSINRVFHSMVLITQNQYQRDPYMLVVNGRVKVSPNYRYDVSGGSYIDTGLDIPDVDASKWTYPNHRRVIPGFGSFPEPEPNKGSTALGITDGVYRKDTASSLVAVVHRFANCGLGLCGGPRALGLDDSASSAYWTFGASLILLPAN